MNIGRTSKSDIGAAASRTTRMFYLLVCCKKPKDKGKQYYNNLECCFIQSWKLFCRKKTVWRRSKLDCWGSFWAYAGGRKSCYRNCVMGISTICIPRQIFLGTSNHGGWDSRVMWQKARDKKCIQDFVGENWSKNILGVSEKSILVFVKEMGLVSIERNYMAECGYKK